MIIEGNFDMEIFKKVSLKEILEDESIFKPKRRDLLKEENIVFHPSPDILTVFQSEEQQQAADMDVDKQRQIEAYKRRFEEALVKIEDKEDVIAMQQARREIDEEFSEVGDGEKKEGEDKGDKGEKAEGGGGEEMI